MMVTSSDSSVPPTAFVAAGWVPSLLFKLPSVNRDTFYIFFVLSLLPLPPCLYLSLSAASVCPLKVCLINLS